MQLEFGTVRSRVDQGFEVQLLNQSEPIIVQPSEPMRRRDIHIFPTAFIVVDTAAQPPQIVWRIVHGRVEKIYDDHITVRGGSKLFLIEPVYLLGVDLDFEAGDEVLIEREGHPNWQLVDVLIDERPAHLELLAEYVFPKIYAAYQ